MGFIHHKSSLITLVQKPLQIVVKPEPVSPSQKSLSHLLEKKNDVISFLKKKYSLDMCLDGIDWIKQAIVNQVLIN